MKLTFTCFLLLTYLTSIAQDDDCMDRIMAKNGGWLKLKETVKAPANGYAAESKYTTALFNSLSGYTPRGLQAQWSGSFMPVMYKEPVARFGNTLYAMKFFCNGKMEHETDTKFYVAFNSVSFVEIYDTTTDYHGTGFHELREGFPTEIKPGIWKLNDTRNGVGGGVEGMLKQWLITVPGQLPWSYVTRKEFLVKRKRNVQKQYAEAKKQTQEAIDFWDTFKKQKEKEFANDATKMANFMTGYYNPGLAEAKAKQPKILGQYEVSLQRIDEQLAAPEQELNKIAIVIKSTSNHLDYDFTDKMEPFASLLVKSNPSYFKKSATPYVPQMISVGIQYNPDHLASSTFAADIEKLLNLDMLQSFIGKNAAPIPAANKSLSNNPANTKNPATSTNTNSKSAPANNNSKQNQTPTGKGIYLTGTLSAPAGVPVTLSFNDGNDLTITPTKGKGNLYNTSSIKFTQPLKEGDVFNVSVKKIASNMKAVIYNGSGKAPDGADKLRIGIDYIYELVSRSGDEQVFSSFYETAAPAIGGVGGEEGRYVTFVSWTPGFAGNTTKFRQVFWRDRNTGETKLISASQGGQPADNDCNLPSMSSDGQVVVFESKATNLVAGDNNNKKDIFLWRANTNTIELISQPNKGGWSDGDSYDAMVSGNAQHVVFTSDATNMATTPKGRSLYNVFLRDIKSGTTEMLSVDPSAGTGGNGVKGAISFDGKRITFCSPSNTLVPKDQNNLWDIFLWEKGIKGLRRISLTHDGKERNQGDESASRQVASNISGNGRYVVYSTTSGNMFPNDNAKYQDVFVYDIETGKLQAASFTDDGQPGNHDSPIEQGERMAISHDGTWVAFPTKSTNLGVPSSNIILFNTVTGKRSAVTNTKGSYVGRPAISYNGSYVIFGKGEALDKRSGVNFGDSGIFAYFTGNGLCRDCK